MNTPHYHRKAMLRASRQLDSALKKASAACGDIEFQAHLSIEENNVEAPWAVRSTAQNAKKAVELAQIIALDFHNIRKVST